jgi:hypothetical protein
VHLPFLFHQIKSADFNPTALPATYACIFGISKGVEGIEKGTLTSVFNEHFSYLVPSGPGDRTYWFLVRNLGKTVYGSEIPRFTKEEEEALAKEHMNDHITPTLRFSDLYNKKIASVYTSLPEYVYKRWYFKRIITIGDASHKVSNYRRSRYQGTSGPLELTRNVQK